MQEPRQYGPASAAITQLLSKKRMGFNELLRALKNKHIVNSGATLAQCLKRLESRGLIRRRVIRKNPPKIVEYRLVAYPPEPTAKTFLELKEHVTVSDSVTVVLTDARTGEKRTLTLGKNGTWIPA